jgi:Transmembrane secretion effector
VDYYAGVSEGFSFVAALTSTMSRLIHSELAQADGASKLGQEAASPWSPLAVPIFRALWIATVASNIGTWMQDVGESWLMVSLTTSPLFVALVETAGSLPAVLLALPASALAWVAASAALSAGK